MINTNGAQFGNQMVQPVQQPGFVPTANQPASSNTIDGVALVHSDEQITKYPVVGGATVALIDLDRNLLVLKTNDNYYGHGLYYETYDLKNREQPKPVSQPSQNESTPNPSNDLIEQVQKDISDLRSQYKEIYEMLEELTAPKKEVTK